MTALLTTTYDLFKELEAAADKEVCYVFFNIENPFKNFASCTSTLCSQVDQKHNKIQLSQYLMMAVTVKSISIYVSTLSFCCSHVHEKDSMRGV